MSETLHKIASVRTGRGVPAHRALRERLLELARRYAAEHRLAAPLSMAELRRHAASALTMAQPLLPTAAERDEYLGFLAVLLNNEVWRAGVAGVPMDRRLLLLPQCLRDANRCQAAIHELGLDCKHCGACPIGELSAEATKLGYVVLVAEGSALVMSLVASGRVEAIIGVSCLGVLEKVFPYMEAAVVPGLAIPLLRDGCADTAVDLDWAWDAIYLTSKDRVPRMNLENLQRTVASWFEPGQLQHVLRPDSQAAQLATEWLARSGKRWRPFLSACAYQSLQELDGPLPEDFHKVALAVECFHKASLIHDDIEDHDEFRYGQKTLHEQYGVPIALNVGDMLLGQGYLMIAACQAPPAAKAEMLATASRGHCELCAGQGAELAWAASPGPLSVAQVTQIFRQKTAPAFDVALNLGAIYAGADGEVATILSRYSTALGIAYQIHDDLEDFTEGGTDIAAARPSMLLAIGCEQGDAATRERIASAWAGKARDADSAARHLRQRLVDLGVPAAAEAMLEHHKNLAISALAELENTRLKALLRRVVGRIFVGSGEEVMGCCDEYQAGNA